MISDDLPNRLKNAKQRERRRRAKEQALASKPRLLDLREIAPDLRLYDQPVALPEPRQPAICPTCGGELLLFGHDGKAMLMCESCCRLWPTSADDGATVPKAVRSIIPLAEINLRYKGNEKDYNRVRYAANRESALDYSRAWRAALPEQGKRYGQAYYQANREKILERQLANYHANKAAKQAKQAEYRKKNRDKERERNKRWRAENPEKYQAQRRAYEEANRERIRAQRKARREANLEQDRAYHREYQRRKAAERKRLKALVASTEDWT